MQNASRGRKAPVEVSLGSLSRKPSSVLSVDDQTPNAGRFELFVGYLVKPRSEPVGGRSTALACTAYPVSSGLSRSLTRRVLHRHHLQYRAAKVCGQPQYLVVNLGCDTIGYSPTGADGWLERVFVQRRAPYEVFARIRLHGDPPAWLSGRALPVRNPDGSVFRPGVMVPADWSQVAVDVYPVRGQGCPRRRCG
jgi:hypothetical protein